MLSLPRDEIDTNNSRADIKSLGKLDKAIKLIASLLITVLIIFGLFYQFNKYILSKKSFETKEIIAVKDLIHKHPNNPDLRVRLGILYSQEKRQDEALEQFNQALKIEKDHQGALVYAGIAYLETEQQDEALTYFDKEIKYYKNTRYAKTNKYLEKALYYGGIIHWKSKRYDKAIDYLEHALWISRTSADTYMVLGRVCIDKKDYKKAEGAFKASIKFDPKYIDALYGLALAYEKQGNKDMAIKYYMESLKYQPDFELASDALNRLKSK